MKEATLGAGCFWCIEACYKEMKGILSVTSGYAGGHVLNPTYKQVCEGTTGHAEVARIVYDENQINFADLLKVFWFIHDPTQLNRQGNDVGTQYRSVIFFHDDEQRQIAESYKQKLIDEQVWDRPIVTEISPLPVFYAAEDYHQDYYDLNPGNAYCQAIVRPKVEKFKKVFEANLKA